MIHLNHAPLRKSVHALLCLLLLLPLPAFCQREKMSAFVRKAWLKHSAMRSKGVRAGTGEGRITAFVKGSSRQAVEGCKVLAEFPDGLFIASVPLGMLGEVAARQAVVRIEAGKPCSALNDTSAVMTRQCLVWDAPRSASPLREASREEMYPAEYQAKGYTGRGVVVGLMDIGFDLTHPTFLSSDGTTLRVKAFWDQLDASEGGEPYLAGDTVAPGRQYAGTEALLSKGRSTDGTVISHGTHTAGTAAGSGWDGRAVSPFRGMAPEADICLVANYTTDNLALVPEEERYKYTSATDVLGFKYIFDYAASAGKPCVASFSEGSHMALGDDGILMQEALSSLTGEGRIIVASAGNEGIYRTHILKPAGKPSAGAFILAAKEPCYTFRSTRPMTVRLTFYPEGEAPVVKDLLAESILGAKDGMVEEEVIVGGTAFSILAAAFPEKTGAGGTAAELLLSRPDGGYVGRDIPVSVTLIADGAEAEAFSLGGYFTSNALDASLADAEKSYSILSPGGLDGIVCVGAVNARDGYLNHKGVWQTYGYGSAGCRAVYSSVGPTVHGLVKPDICAPGTYVKSALNSWYLAAGGDDRTCVETFAYDGTTYGWAAFTGTSMATPVVSGIIAAWLEACPALTPRQIVDVLAHTAAPVPSAEGEAGDAHGDVSPPSLPSGALRRKDNLCGYGLIDAYAGLRYILEGNVTGIAEKPCRPSAASPSSGAVYDLHGRRVAAPVPGRLYIVDGRKRVF